MPLKKRAPNPGPKTSGAKKRDAKPPKAADALPHLDARGHARMVDVGAKPATARRAIAEAFVRMRPDTVKLLADRALAKGDALAVARIAGIQAAKRTPDLIPLAHPLLLTHVAVDIELEPDGARIETCVETTSPTGVEMEALTAATAAALSIYDMAKKHDREMVIERVQLLLKTGGQSGTFVRRGAGERA